MTGNIDDMKINSAITFVILTLCAGSIAANAADLVRDDLTEKDRTRVEAVTQPTNDFAKAEKFETMSGGAATSTKLVNRDAFSQFSSNLTFEQQGEFQLGNALFRKMWVSSPSSTQASDGLGPLFNSRSCQTCHLKDGRGHPPEGPEDDAVSMFLRLSVPPHTDAERELLANRQVHVLPEPTYGTQFQDLAIPGLPAEGKMVIHYEEEPITLADGTVVNLRHPTYSVTDLGYGPMADDVMLSPRVAPPMTGMGLLEAIHPADILALSDVDDADGNGISGKPGWLLKNDELVLGRFGWKAGQADIRGQSASAFAGDIGISTPEVMKPYGDCTGAQKTCLDAATGIQPRLGDSEAPNPIMDLVTFYSENLAPPARRDVDDPEVLRGKQIFYDTGCTSCHNPKFVTRRDANDKAQQFQLIWPYTDLLLHDMGEELADNRPEGDADGYEWRTPPLWGIGLTKTVSDHTFFLHDGRARNLLEAIVWHGGEAAEQRNKVVALDTADRHSLIAFLESL